MIIRRNPDKAVNEFSDIDRVSHLRQAGLTNVEAIALLRAHFPDAPDWIQWIPYAAEYFKDLRHIVDKPGRSEGGFEGWTWKRVPSHYCDLDIWKPFSERDETSRPVWAGMLRITGPANESFLLFSYLCSTGETGDRYFVSTTDTAILDRFGMALHRTLHPPTPNPRILVHTSGTEPDIELDSDDIEAMILDDDLECDIRTQALAFFQNKGMYERLGVPFRRGFLLAGPPGNGKTMMVRSLIRVCCKACHVTAWAVRTSRHLDDDDLGGFLRRASTRAPAIVVMEEIDSLVMETSVTRAGLLSQLDGLTCSEGLLMLATTNNPTNVDPALADRPSRFDRVWVFEPPSSRLRRRYISDKVGALAPEATDRLVRGTEGWSFAYLNELRTTAAVLAINLGLTAPDEPAILEAHRLLSGQFSSAKRNHRVVTNGKRVGFMRTA